MRTVIGTIRARVPKVPRMPVERSWVTDPKTGPVSANLNDRYTEGSTVSTSAWAIGISIGPIERKGWPKARTESCSTHVTVPVAASSMSPERRTVERDEPGRTDCSAPETLDSPEDPAGAATQPAASATFPKNQPGAPPGPPAKETGIGSDAIDAEPSGRRKGARSASRAPENRCSANIETSIDARTAGPPMGTGGARGACRMSSMLWIGVMPHTGSFENGQP